MAKIKPIKEVMESNPGFTAKWNPITEKLPDGKEIFTGLENPTFGRVQRVVVCRDDGTPMWDQYQIEEGPKDSLGNYPLSQGAVVVPYFKDGNELRLGVLERIRELIPDPTTRIQGSYKSHEFVRGFSELGDLPPATAFKELEQEAIGKAKKTVGEQTFDLVKGYHSLGPVNPNTAFYTTRSNAFAIELDPQVEGRRGTETKEQILKCDWKAEKDFKKMLREGKVYCGFTQAAYGLFNAFRDEL